MRRLSETYMHDLRSGFLSGLRRSVVDDSDLNLEIRENYLNVYFKGNSLLKLSDVRPSHYRCSIHPKFLAGLPTPSDLVDVETTNALLSHLPRLKQNVILYTRRSIEIEYEQLIIRANNYEPRNASEYFIVDRQYAVSTGRFDLTGIYWNRNRRRKHQEVPLCFFEVKLGLNPDISEIHDQLERYYKAIAVRSNEMAEEQQHLFRQKLELGLYNHPSERLAAMETLVFSRDVKDYQFVLVFVDYNPNSSKLNAAPLKKLKFAKQIRLFHSGFGMWAQNVRPLTSDEEHYAL